MWSQCSLSPDCSIDAKGAMGSRVLKMQCQQGSLKDHVETSWSADMNFHPGLLCEQDVKSTVYVTETVGVYLLLHLRLP